LDGLWITSDVSTRQTWQRVAQSDAQTPQRIGRISDSTQTSLENNVFADEDDARRFFAEAGFAIEEFQQSETLEMLSSIKRLGLTEDETLKIQQVLLALQ
jgi:hypothetical protein